MTKEKGAWVSRTVAEWKNSKASTWKAQISTSPNGQKFLGVRQYITTAKSGEIAGKGGFNFLEGPNSGEFLDEMIRLLTALKGSKGKKAATEDAVEGVKKPVKVLEEKKPRKSRKATEPEEVKTFGLINESEDKWLVSVRMVDGKVKVKSTDVEEDAKTFKSESEAEGFYELSGLKSKWRSVRVD